VGLETPGSRDWPRRAVAHRRRGQLLLRREPTSGSGPAREKRERLPRCRRIAQLNPRTRNDRSAFRCRPSSIRASLAVPRRWAGPSSQQPFDRPRSLNRAWQSGRTVSDEVHQGRPVPWIAIAIPGSRSVGGTRSSDRSAAAVPPSGRLARRLSSHDGPCGTRRCERSHLVTATRISPPPSRDPRRSLGISSNPAAARPPGSTATPARSHAGTAGAIKRVPLVTWLQAGWRSTKVRVT